MTIPRPNTHPDVAKNQHLVPQTYMRAWSYNGGNLVWVYDKKRLKAGFPIPAEEDVWKIESRSIKRINAITNFYDMKAGDMYLNEEALDEIYGFLNGYDISFEGESLDTYEKLNQHYFDIDNWEIRKPDGTSVFNREHNLIKQNLQQARYTFIETNWSSQYENEWEDFIGDIEKRVRIKKQLLPGKAYLRSSDMEKLMKYFIMFDWRSEAGNFLVNDIIEWFVNLISPDEIEIPEEERSHKEDNTILKEFKHNFARKAYYEYLNDKGTMATYMRSYLQNMSFVFLLTDSTCPFITSERPAMVIDSEDGLKEHILVATPTLLVSTRKTDNTDKFRIFKLTEEEVLRYNKKIAKNSESLILTSDTFNVKQLFE